MNGNSKTEETNNVKNNEVVENVGNIHEEDALDNISDDIEAVDHEISGNKDIDRSNLKELKVKADPENISPEERKRNVKKLAGAISHSLRNNGEINVRCFGAASVGKAAKALSIARNYISVQNLQLACAPAFITTKIGDKNLTGISFCTFAQEKTENIDIEKVKSVLMVKSDKEDMDHEAKKQAVKKLAGAITHALEDNKEVLIRCFGNATICKAAKAIAIARGYTALRGPDLYCFPMFIVANINGEERTGIAYYAFTNEI